MRNRATQYLSKPKVRQSWSKWNLYNMMRFRIKSPLARTHFQQKWDAKSITRGYHGEQVPEKQWARMFSPRIRSVVPMDTYNLAADDGSKWSAGRGQGVHQTRSELNRLNSPPFGQATYAPLERRLDVAVFRAMFASSARQARQFVIHGAVTVNGKKMRYPGYLLNPGDLFQVEPERVMFATGAPKDKYERRAARVAQKQKAETTEEGEAAAEESKEEEEGEAKEKQQEELSPRETLKVLLSQAKNVMSDNKAVLPAKRKQELRGFQKAVRRVLSRSESSTVLTDNLEAQFSELTLLLKAKKAEKETKKENKEKEATPAKSSEAVAEATPEEATKAASEADSEAQPGDKLSEAFRQAAENPEEEVDTSELSDEEFEVLRRALVQMRDNPIDHSKPYATPWRPRDYMNVFATIPRYLEVHPKACAAVYLRHPVVRPGFSEVPSPFAAGTGELAFSWYLRRR
ncbi:alpha-L RNA-binding motif-containing protein [Aspergillus sclerotioniger CBS 115572]|uniref:Small ribosomal subunit protein uS4m n=1 Tax=Aspergillus sclerotioniger CBS 115572 TaxID=1450535 RepID=A0A317VVU9_9EURO|nr:alpha-L RNA-binding motif-containing protein [Aspergillus sclerotioniger CBS 115572]PWY78464.1 alpha-L RNA-binding motif-containing protein [Aspergillus sclerotioniger CBS 115572]